MALGGFRGTDPILTQAQFAELVRTKQVRFVVLGRGFGRGGADPPQKEIVAWVREHGAIVPPEEWSDAPRGPFRAPGDGRRQPVERTPQLYDCGGEAPAALSRGSASG